MAPQVPMRRMFKVLCSGREGGDLLAVVNARSPNELAGRTFALNGREIRLDHGHAAGVADQDNSVGQLLGTDVQMEYGTVAVDDEFRFGNTHNIEF